MSNNLNLDQVAPSQSSKEATINAATGELDAALTEFLVIDMTNNVTLSALNYQRYLKYKLTPTGTSKTLTLPAQKKFSIISNDGTLAVTIAVGTATVSLAANSNGFFYTDGTANGLAQQGGGAGGGSFTLTTSGTSGLASFTGGVLNVPHYQDLLTLTTTGTSGAATLAGGALNIPNYATGGGGGAPNVADNTTTVTAPPLIKFTSGATVTNVGGNANVAIAGGGGATITVSDTPPGSPTAGALWFDSVGAQLYIYYNDGNSSQWVPATNQGGAGALSGRNRLINGAMLVDQRFNGANQNPIPNGGFVADRWKYGTSAGACSAFQALTPGYGGYIALTVQTAHTPAAGDATNIAQAIEGLNISDLGWGAAGAKAVTLSFLVLCTLTGTFSGSVCNGGGTRSYPFTFSIPVGNTWTPISITIPGDVTGTWTNDNSTGIYVRLDLGSGATWRGSANTWQAGNFIGVTGAVNFIATASAVFQLTDVQFEAGTIATPFERRSVGAELALCQRYYQRYVGPVNVFTYPCFANTVSLTFSILTMRTTPTATMIGTWSMGNCSAPVFAGATPSAFYTYATYGGTGQGYYANPANGGFDLSAEL